MTNPNTLTLFRIGSGWVAAYGGPWTADVIDLFGTATLPTAFTAEALPATVLAEITAKNPGAVVRLAQERA